MNTIVIALRDVKAETRFTNDQKAITSGVGTFIDSYGDDPAEYTLNLVQWKEATFPKIGVYTGRIDITTHEGKREVKLVVESVIPLTEYAPINSMALVGRSGSDPEAKYFESGRNNSKFNLAVNKIKSDEPNWFSIELWGKTAEIATNYVRKGSLVGINGSLKFESWIDRNSGEPRCKAVVKGERLHLLGSKKDNELRQESTGWDEEF